MSPQSVATIASTTTRVLFLNAPAVLTVTAYVLETESEERT